MTNPLHNARPVVAFMWRWQHRCCYLCGQRMGTAHDSGRSLKMRATVDHVLPVSMGGKRNRNTALAHHSCNNAKKNRAPKPCEVFFAAEAWRAYESGIPPRRLKKRSWATVAKRRQRNAARHHVISISQGVAA